jgi:hypothetical protein
MRMDWNNWNMRMDWNNWNMRMDWNILDTGDGSTFVPARQ